MGGNHNLDYGTISSRLVVKKTVAEDSGVFFCKSSKWDKMAGVKVEVQSKSRSKENVGQG